MSKLSKICRACNQEKSLLDFGPCKKLRDGRTSVCRGCANERSAQWKRNKAANQYPTEFSLEEFNKHIRYENGSLYWKLSRGPARAGARINSARGDMYLQFCFKGRMFYAHRVVWLLNTGSWPVKHIDHINRDRSDNRFENLRECTPSQNMANSRHKGKFRGVSRAKSKYRACVGDRRLGVYATDIEAAKAYDAAAKERWGEFANLNFGEHK